MPDHHPDERHGDYADMQMRRGAARLGMWALFAFAAGLLIFILYAGVFGGLQNLVLLPLVLFPLVWALRLMTDIGRSQRAEARMRANDRAGRPDGPASRMFVLLPVIIMSGIVIWTVGRDFLFNTQSYRADDLGWLALLIAPVIVMVFVIAKFPRRTDRPKGTLEQELLLAEQTKRNTLMMWGLIAIFGIIIIGAAMILPAYLMGPPAPYLR